MPLLIAGGIEDRRVYGRLQPSDLVVIHTVILPLAASCHLMCAEPGLITSSRWPRDEGPTGRQAAALLCNCERAVTAASPKKEPPSGMLKR